MGRKSTKRARVDALNQFQKRKHKRKASPQGPNDKSYNWTSFLMKQLAKKGAEK